MGLTVDVLIDGADGLVELGGLNGGFELVLGVLHQGRMEGAAHGQHDGPLGTGFLNHLAGALHGLAVAGDDQLTGIVVVGGNHDALALLRDGGAMLLHLFVGHTDDGGHRTGIGLTALLHGHSAGAHQLETVGKRQGAGSRQSGEFTQRVTAHHVGLELVAQTHGLDHAVEEDGRLRHLRLAQILGRAFEHQIGDAEAENLVGLLEELLGLGVVVIKCFTHTGGLCALSGKYKCFHCQLSFNGLCRNP